MLQKGWLLLLTTFMLVIVIHARQISFKEENRVKHAVYLSPKFLLGAGSVIGKFYQNLDFPRGHVALKEFNAEIVDEDGNYVSLHETITFRSCEINIEQCSISNSAPTHAAVPSINNATVVTLLLLSDTIQVWAVDIAVKVLKRSDERVEEQFMAEVGTIGRTYHINLVRLYGFCFDNSMSTLVYKFIENESLDNFLFMNTSLIEFNGLHEIAVGTTKRLSYLHQECLQMLVHYDIKPGNILLDSNFSPKVIDFGLAKL